MTPLVTVTPRLEQEFRYDQLFETSANGSQTAVFDNGKGLELIPTTTNEALLNLPAFQERTIVKPAQGTADWGSHDQAEAAERKRGKRQLHLVDVPRLYRTDWCNRLYQQGLDHHADRWRYRLR